MDVTAQRRSLVIIWITIFIDLMGLTLIIPFINDFVAELGGDEQAVGLLLGSYAAMQLLFAPVWGRIIGPPYGGFTYARINFYFPFLSAAATALAALGFMLFFRVAPLWLLIYTREVNK